MIDDIVARLRLYAERQKQTRSTVLGLLLIDSADEIERLRDQVTAAHESHGNEVGALTERMSLAIHERDEARRSVCCGALPPEYRGWGQEAVNLALREIAKQQGWDCYEENTDG